MSSLDNAVIKGIEGELLFKNYLNALQEAYDFKYIDNLNVYKSYGSSSTQIDFCILTRQQLMCIEIKNWSNTVYAKDEPYWTLLKDNMEKVLVTNPYYQNITHCKALQYCTGYVFENYVLFSDECIIRNKVNRTLNFSDFQSMLHDLNKMKLIYSNKEIGKLYDTLVRFKSEFLTIPHIDY